MKHELAGHHFARGNDAMNDVEHFLKDQNGAFCIEGIRVFHDNWTKCVIVRRD